MRVAGPARVRLASGVELRVSVRGADRPGVPILLLHGFTGSVEAWGEIPSLLAEERPVVTVDLPGHGESTVPRDPEATTLEAVVRGLEETLDAVEAPTAVWAGYSMGGRVALGAGVLAPGRVRALILESASPGLEAAGERQRRRASDEARARELDGAAEAQAGGNPAPFQAWVDAWMDLPLFASQSELPGEVRARERRRRLRSRPAGWAATLRGLGTGRQPSFWDDLGGVEAPALVLTGARDEKFEALGHRMADRLPRARRVSVPGAGHAVHLERPGAWLHAVREFVRQVEAGSGPEGPGSGSER